MTEANTNLMTVLGLSNMIEHDSILPVPVEQNGSANISQDFDLSRSNLKSIVDKSMKIVNDIHDLATTSQSHQYYRVLNESLKTAVEANKALLEIHRELRETTTINQPTVKEQNITHNQVFVGSTADLQNMIEQMKNGKLKPTN